MTTMYIPKNVNQTFFLIVYPNKVYQLLETDLEKQQPMYMGKDRIKLEAMLKNIKAEADNKKYTNTKLLVYDLTNNGLTINTQSAFNNIIASK